MRVVNTLASQFHESSIMSINYNTSKELIFVGDEKGTLHVYSERLKHLTSFFLHHQSIYSLDSCQDYLATISSDGQGILSDLCQFDPIALIGDNSHGLKSVDICPFNTNILTTSGKEGLISLLDKRILPSISFGVDHYYAVKLFRNGKESSIKNCVGKCIWITENHFISFGLSDNKMKLWDLRTNKHHLAENDLGIAIHDICKMDGSITALNSNGIVTEMNPWDLSICNQWETGLKTSQFSRVSYQDSSKLLGIGSKSGNVGYLSFQDKLNSNYRQERMLGSFSNLPNPIFYTFEGLECEINAFKALKTPYSFVSGDDAGNIRLWETESPGNDIHTAILQPDLTKQQLEIKKVSKFYDASKREHCTDTIHFSQSSNSYKGCLGTILHSTIEKQKLEPTKSATFLTPMKKKRRTLDRDDIQATMIDKPKVKGLQTRLSFGNSLNIENVAPKKKKQRKQKIKMDSLLKFGFSQ